MNDVGLASGPWPVLVLARAATEGALIRVEIVREGIAEAGRPKLPKARPTDKEPSAGPSLRERIGAARETSVHGPDAFEAAGWTEVLEQAASGEIAFPGGALRIRGRQAAPWPSGRSCRPR